jgi:hypothetical protein
MSETAHDARRQQPTTFHALEPILTTVILPAINGAHN